MRPVGEERGSTLIMVLGVIATLAILTVTLVALLGNVQYATSKERARTKAFNVAEAGLDLGQQKLDQAWPASEATPVASLRTTDFLSLREPDPGAAFFDRSEYPDLAVRVDFFDNDDPDDGQMYIRSVASVGGRTAAVQALVSKVQLEVDLPPDIVLYTEGKLTIQGTGSQDAVGTDEVGASATAYYDPTQVEITGNPKGNPVDDDDTHSADRRSTSLESVFPTLNDLIDEADMAGRKFATAEEFEATQRVIDGVAYTGWALVTRTQPHIVVIDKGDITLPATNAGQALSPSIWSEDDPGILIVPNGKVWIKGQTTFYGIIFCKDVFEGGGTPAIHGAVIALNGAILHGDRALNYNSKVMFNLDRMLVDSVRVVPGTWRELRGQEIPAG